MVAFRGGARSVPRLRRIEDGVAGAAPLAFDANDTVLITGGSGGLGLLLAVWLVEHGVAHLMLVSRHGPSSGAQAQIDRLRGAGVDIVSVRADVSDYHQLQQEIGRAAAGRPSIAGMFHLAGVLDDGALEHQTWERFDRVFRPKVDGAWNLHRLSRGLPIKQFVMFSSVASIVAVPGQANYAAANAFLDALAHHRRAQGLPALAVNWGPWAEAGHAATEYGRQAHARLNAMGIEAIAPDTGLRLMESLLGQGRTQAAAVVVDWPRLFGADPAAARTGLLADLVAESAAAAPVAGGTPSELVIALRALPDDERRASLLRCLSDLIVGALKIRTGEPIDSRQRLFDLGLDSILAIEVKDRLERALGQKLSATLLFVHPTLETLSAYILAEIVGASPRMPEAVAGLDPEIGLLSEDELAVLLLREIDASRGA
jgi:NAD(P)-dependent dehydrogenase (short-subunit alcohol dehydrogenase family)/acyl carrier protein